jgi:hypothetical protein
MPFPLNPSNNQEIQVNGIIYIWSAAKGAWRRKPGVELGNADNGDQVFNGNIIANSGARATSTTTGAIQVTRSGGIGVTGNVFANAFYSDNYRYANGAPLIISSTNSSNIANIANIAYFANTANIANVSYYSFYSNVSGNIRGGEAGQLVYQVRSNVTSFVTNGDYGKILASNGPGNMPVWVSLEDLYVMNGQPQITQLVYPDGGTAALETGGETIYVIGQGFQPGFDLTVNNAPVISASYISSSNVSFITSNTVPGSYPVTLTNPNRKFTTYNYLEVSGAGFPRFLNPEGYLNFAPENLPFFQYVYVTGGYPPYNWQIISGGLPAGMTLDNGSGLISGTAPDVDFPTAYYFTMQVTDNSSQVITRRFYIMVSIPLILSNELTLSSVGSNFLSARRANANASARTVTLSSVGSNFLSARRANANAAVYTVNISSVGSNFLNSRIATANAAVEDYTLPISSQGSNFLNSRIATANSAVYTLTLSSNYYNR